MTKDRRVRNEHEIFPLNEKPEPMGKLAPPRSNPKRCPMPYCKAWMDEKATECPYCNYPMGKNKLQ